jgi:hypothetical protein
MQILGLSSTYLYFHYVADTAIKHQKYIHELYQAGKNEEPIHLHHPIDHVRDFSQSIP